MEQHLREIREDIVQDGYKANKHPKALVIQALKEPMSVPSLYRTLNNLDNKIIREQNNEQTKNNMGKK